MIISDEWIWLHFPKCAGTYIERAIRDNFTSKRIKFDVIDHSGKVIWHHTLAQRQAFDPDFLPSNKRIICAIRRLPSWLLSRVHFECARPPYHLATRAMLEHGRFFENTGFINRADDLLMSFEPEKITDWLRQEHLSDDLRSAFGDNFRITTAKRNVTKIDYIKDINFWFTPHELRKLYNSNPMWAELEERLYGSLIRL